MIHLFKKVYLTTDRFIDVHTDRIVISEEHGFPMTNDIYAKGTLFGFGANANDIVGESREFTSWVDFFTKIDLRVSQTNSKFFIYADDSSLCMVLKAWYTLLLPNASETTIIDLTKTGIFRINVFQLGTFQSSSAPDIKNATPIEYIAPPDMFISGTLEPGIIDNVSVEFLLASYLVDKSKKQQLKSSIAVLIKKDLEKYLYELKEIFFVHLLTPRFTKMLDFTTTPDISNIAEVLEWKSKFVDVFTSKRLWNTTYIATPSASNPNIKLTALTSADIDVLKEFTEISGETWSEEMVYKLIKSDVNKLDFLPTQNPDTFTDELLNHVIAVEATYEHAAGSFFSIDLSSVNHYIVSAILNANNVSDKDYIKQFSL